jgi:hypothetical protein
MRAIAAVGLAAALGVAFYASTGLDSKRSGTAAEPSGEAVTGTVLETMDSGGYTYIRLRTASGEVWAAINQAKVQKGQALTVGSPIMMQNFESKTLHRQFDKILFGSLASPTGAPQGEQAQVLPPGHPAMSSSGPASASMGAQHAAAAAGPADVGSIKVPKAEAGNTVAEIYGQRAALKDKEVAVRGTVVKYTPEVMGKNWIHLRDGSGSRDKKNDDITVTTTGTVAAGDVILVRGVVRLDRDFGAGYTYAVIIEDATVSK